jgi:hypothetical protein
VSKNSCLTKNHFLFKQESIHRFKRFLGQCTETLAERSCVRYVLYFPEHGLCDFAQQKTSTGVINEVTTLSISPPSPKCHVRLGLTHQVLRNFFLEFFPEEHGSWSRFAGAGISVVAPAPCQKLWHNYVWFG